jgi:hypothetical protein
VVLLGVLHAASFLPVALLVGNAWLAWTRLRTRLRRTADAARAG